jgi:HemY protein
MRGVIWLVVLFVVAVVAATTLGTNDGLVTVYFSRWRIELSLNLFVLLVVGVCFVILTASRTLEAVFSLPRRAHEWRALQRERAAYRALRDALAEFFAARYSRAYKSAERALALQDDTEFLASDIDFRLLAGLLVTSSLHRLQDTGRRDEATRRLQPLIAIAGPRPAAEGAKLMAAEWALDDRDASRALELLSQLPPGLGRRTQALRLKLQAARLARQPVEALQTARLLAKHQAFSEVAAKSLLRTLAIQVLEAARDADQLRRQWQELELADRRDAAVASRAAMRAASLGAHQEARQWLRPLWDRLAELSAEDRAQVAAALCESVMGQGPDLADWLPKVEAAMTTYPSDPVIGVAGGLVMAERGLWGKARRPLEHAANAASLDPRLRRRAWRELARLSREEGNLEAATRCMQRAAEIP